LRPVDERGHAIMKIFIKNMVSERCKALVRKELAKLDIPCDAVDLGVAEIKGAMTDDQQLHLSQALKISGLEIIIDKKRVLIERLKTTIIQLVHIQKKNPNPIYRSI
jgi:hypothetical protein